MKAQRARLIALAPKLLAAAPELAALALLDRALTVAEHSLLAEYPPLAGTYPTNCSAAAPLERARRLLGVIRPLRRELARYRRGVREHLRYVHEDDLPF